MCATTRTHHRSITARILLPGGPGSVSHSLPCRDVLGSVWAIFFSACHRYGRNGPVLILAGGSCTLMRKGFGQRAAELPKKKSGWSYNLLPVGEPKFESSASGLALHWCDDGCSGCIGQRECKWTGIGGMSSTCQVSLVAFLAAGSSRTAASPKTRGRIGDETTTK